MFRRLFTIVVSALILGVATLSPTAAIGSPATAPLVGRRQQSHTCDELVSALNALGLGSLAPVDDGTYVIVDSNTFMIGDATFDYSIHGGNGREHERRVRLGARAEPHDNAVWCTDPHDSHLAP